MATHDVVTFNPYVTIEEAKNIVVGLNVGSRLKNPEVVAEAFYRGNLDYADLPPDVAASVLARPAHINYWDREQLCTRCGVVFTEKYNMGQWKCKFHPLDDTKSSSPFLSRMWADGAHQCCNYASSPTEGRLYSSSERKGCTGIDHSSEPLSAALPNDVSLYTDLFDGPVDPPSHAIKESFIDVDEYGRERRVIIVGRYDWNDYHSRTTRGLSYYEKTAERQLSRAYELGYIHDPERFIC